MIVACPFCQTRFLVPASVFVSGARRVRCGRCSHSWEAEPPREIDVVAPPLLEAEPSMAVVEPAPLMPGANLPALRQRREWPSWMRAVLMGGLLVAMILVVAITNRQTLAGRWPVFEPVFNFLGMHIKHTGEGLNIVDVRSELRYDAGIVRLVVEGKVHNVAQKHQLVPNIKATAIGPDGAEIQSWQIDAPAVTLAPDETVPFVTSIRAPDKTVVDVNLEFIELKHGAE